MVSKLCQELIHGPGFQGALFEQLYVRQRIPEPVGQICFLPFPDLLTPSLPAGHGCCALGPSLSRVLACIHESNQFDFLFPGLDPVNKRHLLDDHADMNIL